MSEEGWENLKKKLDECHQWPCYYTFKFIVPQGRATDIVRLFPDETISVRASSQQHYESLTVRPVMKSSEEVIAIYREVSLLKGVIAL